MHHNNTDSLTATVLKEVLKETKSLHRWRLFGRFIWFLIIIMIIFLVAGASENKEKDSLSPHIAVVSLHGVISQGSDASVENFIPLLEKAFKEKNAKTIFIDANSPGGSPVQSAIINDAIARLKIKYPKPVVAVISDLCASGCYYAIAGVDKIISHQASIVGSIGVRLESFDLRGLMEKIGVKQRLLTAGENKAIINPFGELTQQNKQHLQDLIDKSHAEFITAVERGRGSKLDETNPDLFSGLVWIGTDSVDLGLVDELSDIYNEAENYDTSKLVRYEKEQTFYEQLLNAISGFGLQTYSSIQAKYQ
jgi:protease-4